MDKYFSGTGYPHGPRKTITLVAGLRMTGMVAPMVLDGAITGEWSIDRLA